MLRPFKIVVTGLGTITSLGNKVDEMWSAICTGRSGIKQLEGFKGSAIPIGVGGEVLEENILSSFEPPLCNTNSMLIYAASQAIEDAKIESGQLVDFHMAIPSLLCNSQFKTIRESMALAWKNESTFDMPTFLNSLITSFYPQKNQMLLFPFQYLAARYNFCGKFTNINVACASGAQVMQGALESIYLNPNCFALTAAVNSNLDPYYLVSMKKLGSLASENKNIDPEKLCRPFDANRTGLVMSDGAVAMILESEAHAKSRGAKIYACIDGVGMSADGYHPTAPAPDGSGMILAMEKALSMASCNPKEIDYINAHGTGTPLNDRLETKAIKAVFGTHADKLLISSTKATTGHMFTAAGMLEAIISALACRDDIIPPTINYKILDPD
mmetsp:Transcript_23722/g.11425  ORF Transcript_23722/g.11425 Transcript_23722/m.11425 type:complete len:385 (-) Transcript_23722:13-1167(-)